MTDAEQKLIDPETHRPLLLEMRAAALARGDDAAIMAAGLIMQTATSAAISIFLAYEGAAKASSGTYADVVASLDDPIPDPVELPPETIAIPPPQPRPVFKRAPSPPAAAGLPPAEPRAYPMQPPSFPKRPPRITGPDLADDEIPF